MKSGARVVLVSDPLRYGYGTLQAVLSDGRVTVKWENGDIRPVHPLAIESADLWERRSHGALTNDVLDRLTRGERDGP